jgi:hypothetical protein
MSADPLASLHDDLGVLAVALVPFSIDGTVVTGSLLMLRAAGPAGPGQTRLAGPPCHPPAGRARHIIRGGNTP